MRNIPCYFFFLLAEFQDGGVSARAWIAKTGAIGKDLNGRCFSFELSCWAFFLQLCGPAKGHKGASLFTLDRGSPGIFLLETAPDIDGYLRLFRIICL